MPTVELGVKLRLMLVRGAYEPVISITRDMLQLGAT